MADRQSAVRKQSGQSVSPSDPVLGNGPTSLTTADRKSAARLPYTSQRKTGWEFEGGALISAEGAVPLALLDQKKNNRDTPHDPYRASRCRRLSLRAISPATPNVAKFFRVTCKCWDCPACAKYKANRYRKAIGELAEDHHLNILLTLTLDPRKLKGKDSTRHINEVFSHFRTYLKRKLGHSPTYIRVLEYQQNGRAHLHVLLGKYIQQSWVSDAWASLGGGKVVDIRRVSMRKVSHYLSKYLTKEMILSAPKRSRRVTTSRGLKLNPKVPTDTSFALIRIPLKRLFEANWKEAMNVREDAEGNVTSFEAPVPPDDKSSEKIRIFNPPKRKRFET